MSDNEQECSAVYTYNKWEAGGPSQTIEECRCIKLGQHNQHVCAHGAMWGYASLKQERINALEAKVEALEARARLADWLIENWRKPAGELLGEFKALYDSLPQPAQEQEVGE